MPDVLRMFAPPAVDSDPELAARQARAHRQRLMLDAGLSDRQAAVLRGLSHGLHNSELARDLGMSEDSVKHDVRMIFRALGATGRAQAVGNAFRKGWLA